MRPGAEVAETAVPWNPDRRAGANPPARASGKAVLFSVEGDKHNGNQNLHALDKSPTASAEALQAHETAHT